MPEIVVPLPASLAEALERVAAETGETVEALIARATEEQLRKRLKIQARTPGKVLPMRKGKKP